MLAPPGFASADLYHHQLPLCANCHLPFLSVLGFSDPDFGSCRFISNRINSQHSKIKEGANHLFLVALFSPYPSALRSLPPSERSLFTALRPSLLPPSPTSPGQAQPKSPKRSRQPSEPSPAQLRPPVASGS